MEEHASALATRTHGFDQEDAVPILELPELLQHLDIPWRTTSIPYGDRGNPIPNGYAYYNGETFNPDGEISADLGQHVGNRMLYFTREKCRSLELDEILELQDAGRPFAVNMFEDLFVDGLRACSLTNLRFLTANALLNLFVSQCPSLTHITTHMKSNRGNSYQLSVERCAQLQTMNIQTMGKHLPSIHIVDNPTLETINGGIFADEVFLMGSPTRYIEDMQASEVHVRSSDVETISAIRTMARLPVEHIPLGALGGWAYSEGQELVRIDKIEHISGQVFFDVPPSSCIPPSRKIGDDERSVDRVHVHNPSNEKEYDTYRWHEGELVNTNLIQKLRTGILVALGGVLPVQAAIRWDAYVEYLNRLHSKRHA